MPDAEEKKHQKTCFVVAPIGKHGSEIRKRSDNVFNYIIAPTVSKFGYEAVRADKIDEPGSINHQITLQLLNAELVIADLTGSNPNVFYELAVRHAFRKPFIQIIKKDDLIPFDIKDLRTIEVDEQDLESVHFAINAISQQIEMIENEPQSIITPISVALDLEKYKHSDNKDEHIFPILFDAITQMGLLLERATKKLTV